MKFRIVKVKEKEKEPYYFVQIKRKFFGEWEKYIYIEDDFFKSDYSNECKHLNGNRMRFASKIQARMFVRKYIEYYKYMNEEYITYETYNKRP